MKPRQLSLPGLAPKASPPRLKAKRDMSAYAFEAALKRHGFVTARAGTAFRRGAIEISGIFRAEPTRLDRRATIAAIVKSQVVRTNSKGANA